MHEISYRAGLLALIFGGFLMGESTGVFSLVGYVLMVSGVGVGLVSLLHRSIA